MIRWLGAFALDLPPCLKVRISAVTHGELVHTSFVLSTRRRPEPRPLVLLQIEHGAFTGRRRSRILCKATVILLLRVDSRIRNFLEEPVDPLLIRAAHLRGVSHEE